RVCPAARALRGPAPAPGWPHSAAAQQTAPIVQLLDPRKVLRFAAVPTMVSATECTDLRKRTVFKALAQPGRSRRDPVARPRHLPYISRPVGGVYLGLV